MTASATRKRKRYLQKKEGTLPSMLPTDENFTFKIINYDDEDIKPYAIQIMNQSVLTKPCGMDVNEGNWKENWGREFSDEMPIPKFLLMLRSDGKVESFIMYSEDNNIIYLETLGRKRHGHMKQCLNYLLNLRMADYFCIDFNTYKLYSKSRDTVVIFQKLGFVGSENPSDHIMTVRVK